MSLSEKLSLKISCIALVLSIISLIVSVNLTSPEDLYKLSRSSLTKTVWQDIMSEQKLLNSVNHPLPDQITGAKINVLKESFRETMGVLQIKAKDNKYYNYEVNAKSKYGFPMIFGWETIMITETPLNYIGFE